MTLPEHLSNRGRGRSSFIFPEELEELDGDEEEDDDYAEKPVLSKLYTQNAFQSTGNDGNVLVKNGQKEAKEAGDPKMKNKSSIHLGGIFSDPAIASITSMPWVVSIYYAPAQPQTVWGYCTGALIKPDWVITAGHCFDSNPPNRNVLVYAGTNTKHRGRRRHIMGVWKVCTCIYSFYRQTDRQKNRHIKQNII